MAGRRPQGLSLDPNSADSARQEPVQLRERGRLGLPLDLVNALAWLAKRNKAEVFALAVLDECGRITLRCWEKDGPSVLDERNRLLEAGDHESVRLLEDRYNRIQVPKDARITLTVSHLLHLGLPTELEADTQYLYVALVGESIQIFSEDFRDRQLARASTLFQDLP